MELDARELELLEKLRTQKIHIPPRPQVLHEIEHMLRDDNATERMISQLIGRDASLTAEVFKLANSAYYRPARKIDSLEHAVRMLGRRPMAEVARGALLRKQLGGNDPRMEGFWERCTDIGIICSVLCDHLENPGGVSSEQAYLVGLFHDCGVPVLVAQLEGYGNKALVPGANADFIDPSLEIRYGKMRSKSRFTFAQDVSVASGRSRRHPPSLPASAGRSR